MLQHVGLHPARGAFMFSSTLLFHTPMAYADPKSDIKWDPPGLFQGVTIRRQIQGEWFAWKIPYNGLVSQSMAADLLNVSVMSINNWVRAGKLRHIKVAGQPSAIPLGEVKKVRKALVEERRKRGAR